MTNVVRPWAIVVFCGIGLLQAGAATYDPLKLAGGARPAVRDVNIHDAARKRDIPVRVYLPTSRGASPVIVFSHGLGGSREGYAYLGEHWAARGYVVVALQHAGSDGEILKNQPLARQREAVLAAASFENLLLRAGDVRTALDQLENWNHEAGHPLFERVDFARAGMAGHSFGALTTQAVSGQKAPRGDLHLTDERIRAAIAFSPSNQMIGEPCSVFSDVKIPWMLMTGTRDDSPIGRVDVNNRLSVFPCLPPGHKYEVVLFEAEHSVFAGRTRGAASGHPNHQRVILALSTAFWDSYLRQDLAAQAWLEGTGPRTVMEKQDRWQTK